MTENSGTKESAGSISFAELVPLGYLYLLVLGIASQSIYFGLLGINFLEYSDLLDVLLRPIALLTGNLPTLILVALLLILLYPYLLLMHRLATRKNPGASARPERASLVRTWLVLAASWLLMAFLGLGLGSGMAARGNLLAGEAEADYLIQFSNGRSTKVWVAGINNSYIFFARPGETQLTIAPIQDNIHMMRKLPATEED